MSKHQNTNENIAASSPGKQLQEPSSAIYKWLRSCVLKPMFSDYDNFQATRLIWIGGIAIFGFPLYGWIWSVVFPQHYENAFLRLLGILLGIPFLFARCIKNKEFIRAYSFAALTYMLPFFFTFMFLMNEGSSVWSQSLLIATVAIFQFGALFASMAWLSGTALAYLIYSALAGHFSWPSAAIMVNIPIDLFAILLVSITKTGNQIFEEKLNGMAAALSSISHELRTPLLSIQASARGLKQYIPPLLDYYNKNKNTVAPAECMSDRHLELTLPAIDHIQAEVRSMNSAIDLLLANTGQMSNRPQLVEIFSIKKLIENTVARYPFDDESSRALVRATTGPDFEVKANKNLMAMVIVNLLKNALKAIKKAKKGEISITLVTGPRDDAHLIIRDTGCGIPRSQLRHIFTRFHSYPAHEGTGIGLAFCRESLACWGAKISCKSKEGEYCEFVIAFKTASKAINGSVNKPVHKTAAS